MKEIHRAVNERPIRSETGQAMIEMALVLMLLVMLAFGVLDLARAFHVVVVTTNAAREGARYGSEFPMCRNATDQTNDARCRSNMEAVAINDAASYGISLTPSQITPTVVNSGGTNRRVTVTVTYNFETILGNLFAASPLTITRDATFFIMPKSW